MPRTNSVCAYAIGQMGKSETTSLLGSLANTNVTTICWPENHNGPHVREMRW